MLLNKNNPDVPLMKSMLDDYLLNSVSKGEVTISESKNEFYELDKKRVLQLFNSAQIGIWRYEMIVLTLL